LGIIAQERRKLAERIRSELGIEFLQ
jgi:hypothetical protein